jgi:SAM-dependent methyltransferase
LKGSGRDAYGESVADDYDRLYPEDTLGTGATVRTLAELAGEDGSVLELGIGTGRLALPLLERGLRVSGIEASTAMVDRLRRKSRGDEIEVVVGDFTSASAGGPFSVVSLAFNAIFGLPDRDAQIACFRNAAAHIEPGGCFVVEAFVLRPEQLTGSWSILPRSVGEDHAELQLARYEPASQRIERTLVHLRPDGVRLVPVMDSYAWPGELDLMARIAGLRLRSRAGGWSGEPFDASSSKHISIYELGDAGS